MNPNANANPNMKRKESKGKRKEFIINTTDEEEYDQLDLLSSFQSDRPLSTSPLQSPPRPSTSTSTFISSPAPSIPPPIPPEQSLQDLLKTVDLGAALLLVNTLQTQQQIRKSPSALTFPPPVEATPHDIPRPTSPLLLKRLSVRLRSNSRATPPLDPSILSTIESISSATAPPDSITPLSSPSTPAFNLSPSSLETRRPRVMSLIGGSNSKDKDRRRSLSISFGPNNKRERFDSTASSLRGIDTRSGMGEGGREFEEQISRVHLTLSAATLRRAQNCDKYLSMLYVPLYTSLEEGTSAPNLLAVSRWREERDEISRRWRRARVGLGMSKIKPVVSGSAEMKDNDGMGEAARLDRSTNSRRTNGSDTASSINLSLSGRLSISSPYTLNPVSYGTKRNKHPKVWEVYPDDVEEYLINDGQNSIEGLIEEENYVQRTTSSQPTLPPSMTTTTVNTATPHIVRSDTASATPPDLSRPASRQGSVEALNALSRSATRTSGSNTNDFSYPPYRPSSLGSGFARSSTSAQLSNTKSTSIRSAPLEPAPLSSSSSSEQHLRNHPRPATPLNDLVEVISSPTPVQPPLTTTSTTATAASKSPSILLSPTTSGLSPRRLPSPSASSSVPIPTTTVKSETLRSTLSRQIDKIRGKNISGEDYELASSTGTSSIASSPITGTQNLLSAIEFGTTMTTKDQADLEGGGGGSNNPLKSSVVLQPGRKNGLNNNNNNGGRIISPSSSASIPYSSPRQQQQQQQQQQTKSSGDEGFLSPPSTTTTTTKRRRRVRHAIWATVTSGFVNKGMMDPLVVTTDLSDLEALRRRRIRLAAEESEEEEIKVIRKVWGLEEDEEERLNRMLSSLEIKLQQVDILIPKVPPLLTTYLASITIRERETLTETGIEVKYPYPRLPASIVKDLSHSQTTTTTNRMMKNVKRRDQQGRREGVDGGLIDEMGEDSDEDESTEDDTSSSSSSSSSISSDEEEDEEDEESGVRGVRLRPQRRATLIAPLPHNRATSGQIDSPSRVPAAVVVRNARQRSHTISTLNFPPRIINQPLLSPLTSRINDSTTTSSSASLDPTKYVDRLQALKRGVEELELATNEIELKGKRIIGLQDSLRGDILLVGGRVGEVQRGIDESDFQLLRKSEDHYFRLRASLSQPSSTLDLFWAGLSYVLIVLFWISWFLVTLFRTLRSILLVPIKIGKWFFNPL